MSVTSDNDALLGQVVGHFGGQAPQRLGIAVSGGSDSTALLKLCIDWARAGGPEIHAVTVDHQLRPEAADEAKQVGILCQVLNVPHDILNWTGWEGIGNVSDQARRARYALMVEWGHSKGVSEIAIGHTLDDQAETLLMRLARQAGLDGLAAMSARWHQDGIVFHRPVLQASRADLRRYLNDNGTPWIEDPSNQDDTYRRVRARDAVGMLEPVGITAEGLAAVASHLADARATLGHYAAQEARKIVSFHIGDVVIDQKGFADLLPDMSRRILQSALKWINGADYGARGQAVERALSAIARGENTTLQGCLISVTRECVRISREFSAVEHIICPVDNLWDGRWALCGAESEGLEIRALGSEGRILCPEWRDAGLPIGTIEASPAIWRGDVLVAAPLAGMTNFWSAKLCRDEIDYYSTLLSH